MRRLLLFCVFFTACLPTFAQRPSPTPNFDGIVEPPATQQSEWVLIDIANDYVFYYNPRRLTRPAPGVVRAWLKEELFSLRLEGRQELRRRIIEIRRENGLPTRNFERFSFTLTQTEFRCAARESRVMSVIDYDFEGQVLDSSHVTRPNWRTVVPESIGEMLLEAVCAAARRR